MTSGVTLRRGKLSGTLRKGLEDHYKAIAGGQEFVAKKWREWENVPGIVVYTANSDGKGTGWIVYDPARSTVEEVLIRGSDGKVPEAEIMDALVAQETLVSAEILAADKARHRWMVKYGLRPTRSFISSGTPMIRMDLSTAVLMKKLGNRKPPRPYGKRERIAIEQVAETQTYEQIKNGVRNLINKLGGLDRFVKPGRTVVVKPNVVSDHGLKDGVYKGGIVTDVRLIRALVEMLIPVAGKVIIAEGSSINRSETGKMFSLYGYDRLVDLDPAKVSLLDLNNDIQVEKVVPGGKRMLSRKIPRTLDEADVIISVPVLKIHFAAVASIAIKHLQGAVPPLEKYMTHFFGLWQNLINIHHLVKPQLIIVDGLTGQEDFGPVSGTPKKMDLLIGGTNPVTVDAVAMRIMGLDPAASPPVWLAYIQGLGPIESERIDVVGPSIDEVKSPFRQPEISLESGRDIAIHDGGACSGCRGYLHFVLSKVRKPDPQDRSRQLIDRPFEQKVNLFLGPETDGNINPMEKNIFLGICQQHNAGAGTHLPGCPPHAEVLVNAIFSLFPDVEKVKYADESEEKKLGDMLQHILAQWH